jgi:hypothetical protein
MIQHSIKFGFITGLDVLIKVLLEIAHLVRDETECMVQREPLGILWILV